MSGKDKPGPAQDPGEWFDIVDEHDQVVGRAQRREVHARKLRHRAVHVLVFRADGAVFLQRRSLAKDSCPGLWDSSCSGHLDAGEGYAAAARRELAEEIGLRRRQAPELWFRIEACAQTGNEFVQVYRTEHNGPLLLNPAEISEGAWKQPETLSREIAGEPERFTPPFRLVWSLATSRLRTEDC
jgi:isopentenyl-diphosphate Delta-isomerase